MQLILRLTIFRGDTISNSSNKAGKSFRLDLRLVIVQGDEQAVDSGTGEMAKKATVQKIYKDKLKPTVASKCHLNTFFKGLPFLRDEDVPLIKMPIIQIAGFDRKLSIISLRRKKEYCLEDIFSFSFPKSLKQIQNGFLKNLVNFLTTVDGVLDNLRKIHHDCSSSEENSIENILTGTHRKKELNYNSWITKTVFKKDDNDEEDSDLFAC